MLSPPGVRIGFKVSIVKKSYIKIEGILGISERENL